MTAPYLEHVSNKPLRDQILDILREAIITGEIKPGQPLVESDIAAQLGVSRAPVREALQALSADALVECIPFHGTVVRSLKRRDIVELYSLRSVFEIFAIQQIIATDAHYNLGELRACVQEMFTAAQAGDIRSLNEIDRQFHDALIRLSRHHLLLMSWSSISFRVRQVMALLNRRFTDLTEIARNHLAITEAIAAGDEALAIDLIREHIAASGSILAEMWEDDELSAS